MLSNDEALVSTNSIWMLSTDAVPVSSNAVFAQKLKQHYWLGLVRMDASDWYSFTVKEGEIFLIILLFFISALYWFFRDSSIASEEQLKKLVATAFILILVLGECIKKILKKIIKNLNHEKEKNIFEFRKLLKEIESDSIEVWGFTEINPFNDPYAFEKRQWKSEYRELGIFRRIMLILRGLFSLSIIAPGI